MDICDQNNNLCSCPIGFYSNDDTNPTSINDCNECPNGLTTFNTGSTSCFCPVNSYSDTIELFEGTLNSNDCVECPSGTFGGDSNILLLLEGNEDSLIFSIGKTLGTKLIPSSGESYDNFGDSVAISGTTAIIGASGDDDCGAAYIYTLYTTINTWIRTSKLIPSTGGSYDRFGESVAISGTTAIISAWGDDDCGLDCGAAYIYTLNTTTNTWIEITKLIPSSGESYDRFGESVAISGTTAIVGASGDDDCGLDCGAAYIYTLNTTTNTWIETTKLIPSTGERDDNFGDSVAISGTTAIVGAWGDDDCGSSCGAAYIYTLNTTTNTWIKTTKLIPSSGRSSDNFGWSVAISGTTAIVGAWGDDDCGSWCGAAYIYTLYTTTNTWIKTSKLIPSTGGSDDGFGRTVAISGTSAIISAYGDDDCGLDCGAAYIYTLYTTTNTWIETTKLIPSTSGSDNEFGSSVAISGSHAIVGVPTDYDCGSYCGAAYITPITPLVLEPSDLCFSCSLSSSYCTSSTSCPFGTYQDEFGECNPLIAIIIGIVLFAATGIGLICFMKQRKSAQNDDNINAETNKLPAYTEKDPNESPLPNKEEIISNITSNTETASNNLHDSSPPSYEQVLASS